MAKTSDETSALIDALFGAAPPAPPRSEDTPEPQPKAAAKRPRARAKATVPVVSAAPATLASVSDLPRTRKLAAKPKAAKRPAARRARKRREELSVECVASPHADLVGAIGWLALFYKGDRIDAVLFDPVSGENAEFEATGAVRSDQTLALSEVDGKWRFRLAPDADVETACEAAEGLAIDYETAWQGADLNHPFNQGGGDE